MRNDASADTGGTIAPLMHFAFDQLIEGTQANEDRPYRAAV
ncbi:hypothetical protein [Mesorhizobium sp. B2-2-3]|nr:hypothetical protein [Mesorhizobium sp. B2-2-3]